MAEHGRSSSGRGRRSSFRLEMLEGRRLLAAPVGVADVFSLPRNGVATLNVLANDVDADAHPLTAVDVTTPAHGTLTPNPDGTFTYAANANFSGTDAFSYRPNDGSESGNVTTVSITVASPPSSTVDLGYQTPKNVPLVVPAVSGVLSNDTDPNGYPLTATTVTQPTNGTVVLNPDGSFTYTPRAGFSGADAFTYVANNGVLIGNETVATITVSNQLPAIGADTYTMDAGTTLTVPAASGVLANDADGDGDPLTASVATGPANGTLVLNPDGSFTYTPRGNFFGTDTFTYTANDGSGPSTGTVTIGVYRVVTLSSSDLPGNDTGVSGDRLTANPTPGFRGATVPGLAVQLFAQRDGSTDRILVGQATADGNGLYSVTSSPLADGTYTLTASTIDPARPGAVAVTRALGTWTIDAAPPKIADVRVDLKSGRVFVTYTESLAGLASSRVFDRNAYVFTSNGVRLKVTGLTAVGDNQVALTVKRGQRLNAGRYRLAIASSAVANRAGNALDGEYRGALPTGDGRSGGDFTADLQAQARRTRLIVVRGRTVRGAAVPGGPRNR